METPSETKSPSAGVQFSELSQMTPLLSGLTERCLKLQFSIFPHLATFLSPRPVHFLFPFFGPLNYFPLLGTYISVARCSWPTQQKVPLWCLHLSQPLSGSATVWAKFPHINRRPHARLFHSNAGRTTFSSYSSSRSRCWSQSRDVHVRSISAKSNVFSISLDKKYRTCWLDSPEHRFSQPAAQSVLSRAAGRKMLPLRHILRLIKCVFLLGEPLFYLKYLQNI